MVDLVVDASVVVKWYIPEQDHQPARALRDDYLDGQHDLFAPALLPFEVVNALKYSGHFDDEQLAEASSTLPEYGIELVPYRRSGSVAEVAAALDITLYDASYVALADSLDSTAYTADSRLLDAVDGGDYPDAVTHVRSYG